LDCFAERVSEATDGAPAMNCQLCKYRTQVIGYETAAGAPQEAHHHHVSGIGTGDHHHHDHDHDHNHGHAHNGQHRPDSG